MRADLPPIYFVRHGETDWNKRGLIQGSLGVDLNEKGMAQAQTIAQALATKRQELSGFEFYASPQVRAQHTMQIIATAQGRDLASIKTDARLREIEFGEWEGKAFYELKASPIYPADPAGLYVWRPKGGESYEECSKRVAGFLRDLTGPAVVVSHGGVGRWFMGLVAGLSPEEAIRLHTPQGKYCYLANGQFEWFDAQSDAG